MLAEPRRFELSITFIPTGESSYLIPIVAIGTIHFSKQFEAY